MYERSYGILREGIEVSTVFGVGWYSRMGEKDLSIGGDGSVVIFLMG